MSSLVRRVAAAGFAVPVLLGSLLLGGAFLETAQGAEGDATIDHTSVADGSVQLLVSVPGDAPVDPASVKVTIDGKETEATAVAADTTDEIERRSVLAIDTSLSMRGDRILAAKNAAVAYLDAVPTNVKVGIVTFDDTVVVRQEPSLDRAASKAVIDALELKLNTALHEGVDTAVKTTGADDAQRQVLVLSDGADNTKTPLAPVLQTIKDSGVKVDAVALEQGATPPASLVAMAEAGGGTVVAADAAALEQAFSSEADALARQILVTAEVPAGHDATDASVVVTLSAGGTEHTASAFVTVKESTTAAPTAAPEGPVPAASSGFEIPQSVMYAALAGIALGVVGVVIGLTSGRKVSTQTAVSEQMQYYTGTAPTPGSSAGRRAAHAQSATLADQARQAASNVLATNTSFEARITSKLEAAGMALKSSEWLLLHLGIAFGAGILGLLISGGNPLFMVLMLAVGIIGPWAYLSRKHSQRLKAFDNGLADTLQLMSGSLSAGLSLAQSLDTIVREGSEPITSEFKRVIVETRLGVGIEDALDGVALRMESKDFQWVVMAIRIQREVGGNLAELLLNVAGTLREREYIRRHVQALSAEGRLSCWILGGLPPAFLAYLTLTRPDYVKPMFTTPIGFVLCIAMALLLGVGIFWMSKVAKVEV